MISNKQEIQKGNGNIQAGRDVKQTNNFFCKEEVIHVSIYEKDILQVIELFEANLDLFEDNLICDSTDLEFDLVEKEEKNVLNNLSKEYFDLICEDYLLFFHRIDKFLKSPQNRQVLTKYKQISLSLKLAIGAKRHKFDKFEEILDDIINTIYNKCESQDISSSYIVIFLNYMYWSCDIGRRKNYDKTIEIYRL